MTYSTGPRLRPDLNPGNARWCTDEGHMRMECTKNRSRGRGVCHGPAVRGTDACAQHGGQRREVLQAKGAAKITAWSAIGPAAQTINYKMAVMGVLQMSWLRLAAYSELLRKQVVKEGLEQAQGEHDPEAPNESGLIGYKYGAAGKDGNIYAVSEEIRALVALEAAERDRVVRIAKTAHDMGINDRMASLAERWGDLVATQISLMFDALDLTPAQAAKVPVLIQAHLGSIDIGTLGGPEPLQLEKAS